MRDAYADRIVRLERAVAALLENELDGGGGPEFYHRGSRAERHDDDTRKDLWSIVEDMHKDIDRHGETGQI